MFDSSALDGSTIGSALNSSVLGSALERSATGSSVSGLGGLTQLGARWLDDGLGARRLDLTVGLSLSGLGG